MTECERLSDRMPDVARGGEVWSAEERAHLETCRECAAEWRLIEAAARVGAGDAAIDPERIARLVRDRMAREGTRSTGMPRWSPARRWLVGLAAAAAVVLAVRLAPTGRAGSDRMPPVAAAIGLDELDDLDDRELETVLADFGPTDGAADERLGDLSPEELQRVLQDWES